MKRALISVSDKSGIVEFARQLAARGIDILSTGGTASLLRDNGVPVRDVSEATNFPEMMDGRVKTLHPAVHGGILALRDNPTHVAQAEAHRIGFIDLVVVNLYPFRETVAKPDVTYEHAIENIDIGGPTMVRSAAKNHAFVGVVTSPNQYDAVIAEIRDSGELSESTRKRLARDAFRHTATYDSAVARYLSAQEDEQPQRFAPFESLWMDRLQTLRYGENPHQAAAFYRIADAPSVWAQMIQLNGKELSYNNILDADAAWGAACDFPDPTAVIVKHTNPCGLASDEDIIAAYKRAFRSDPLSAFGGIIAFNRPVDEALATAIRASKHPTSGDRLFVEIVMAPDFTDEAVERLSRSQNLRVLKLPLVDAYGARYRTVEGGMLIQEADAPDENAVEWNVATKREPTDQEWADLRFAWKCVKHVKSNAIVVAKNRTLLGMGAGQPNRVNSVRLALAQAGDDASGAAMASDALFPFLDSAALGVAHGITAFVQPGGAIRDADSIAVADAANATMVMTGTRHFRH
ncbi:MAG: bifunctional phosphoribosylaminoimidazolecarboxamide formyltransferase/IMP cyclohydrolase [Candidatus Poribacteria bacterium]|nr:bifunctional phosphoribosylaminoimidazolecarboxamide formyltransferase/IMP cyclohydrolase [Candidatus Poribacteria bacterium]